MATQSLRHGFANGAARPILYGAPGAFNGFALALLVNCISFTTQ
jgi:hypothetical protein